MISIVAEVLLDAHFDGEVMRPHPSGGPFNTAVALGQLGVPVSMRRVRLIAPAPPLGGRGRTRSGKRFGGSSIQPAEALKGG
jgi:hypothetical protein